MTNNKKPRKALLNQEKILKIVQERPNLDLKIKEIAEKANISPPRAGEIIADMERSDLVYVCKIGTAKIVHSKDKNTKIPNVIGNPKIPLGREEKEILELLSQGKTIEEIGLILGLTGNRVYELLESVRIKLEASTVREAIEKFKSAVE